MSEFYKRIVVKVGTHVMTKHDGSVDKSTIKNLVHQIACIKKRGCQVILVSSGAVGFGKSAYKLKKPATAIIERQLFSSIGQAKLIESYNAYFNKEGMHGAQILVTKEDFRDKQHYMNMKSCLEALLEDDIIPIANENDTVSIDELMFTDNDELASLIASMLSVDAVIFMSNVEGLYDRFPINEEASLISEVDFSKDELNLTISNAKSPFGRGGMHSKCTMAKKLASIGIATHLIYGKHPTNLIDVYQNKPIGTKFLPKRQVSSLKRRLAVAASQIKGEIRVNSCLEKLLLENEKAISILPIGISSLKGEFNKGDIVSIVGSKKKNLGYGIARYSSKELKELVGQKNKRTFIHYDHLYIQIQ